MGIRSNRARHSFDVVLAATRGLLLALSLVFLTQLSAAVPAEAEAGATVKVDPASSALPIGATTVVNVRIENVSSLSGAEVHLAYDPALVGVQQIEGGGFPAADFVAQSKFGDGKIDYAIAQMPKQHSPANGSGIFLKITLQGKADGVSPLSFKGVILANPVGKAIPVDSQSGQIAVGSGKAAATSGGNDWLQPLRSFVDWLSGLLGLH